MSIVLFFATCTSPKVASLNNQTLSKGVCSIVGLTNIQAVVKPPEYFWKVAQIRNGPVRARR